MLGSVKTILERFSWPAGQGDGDGSRAERADGGTVGAAVDGRSPNAASGSSLYQCPSCERVFVAVEKGRCGTCDASVDEVTRTN